ncbi:chloride channel protein [Longimicrobium sp.]|uniref:chloride channel protein n=1 Tax=Longimicrobium sp. TaxID=2029185 RepID=UPI002E2FB9F2|nr:chloride channel protein [Longimicrobium sp.]HEX6042609.1 chloride channel protein [Longimicrobium sp.]
MAEHERIGDAATADGLAVAPSMAPALASVRAPREHPRVDGRVVWLCGVSIAVAVGAGLIAELLTRLIGLITNLAFYGRLDTAFVSPAENRLGPWVVVVPVLGALVVGVMARYGSAAIRGHGIPEVMEKVLHGESRIAPRVMFLKPLSAAVAIGTGGPFGAEGPIIATGGALGSLVGQVLRITADERKTLLAAGAAAGMAATFGTPVSAVLLAVELLLFEYRARSIVPVALAAAAATSVRLALVGGGPVFSMPAVAQPGGTALVAYAVLGALVGLLAAQVTRVVYAVEDAFERVPLHWMWWPALGAVVVGVVGWAEPRTLGVGYSNIEQVLSGGIAGRALLLLVVLKFVSWAVYLGSGTSGGTLAPLFTIGGGAGALLGAAAASVPWLGVDPHVAALVGMAAIFAGASHALLASVVFAFETTRQPMGLLPLLAGCSAAYLVSLLVSRTSIMTEKLARRGTGAETEYVSDYLRQVRVGAVATRALVTLRAGDRLDAVRAWLASGAGGATHQGFPVVDEDGALVGVLTRRDLLDAAVPGTVVLRSLVRRPPVVVYEDSTLRAAADHMVHEGVGRLAVVSRARPTEARGILTRSDLLNAHVHRLDAAHGARRVLLRRRPRAAGAGDAA